MDTAIVNFLKNESIFSRIQARDIAKLLPHAQQITLKAGDTLFKKGSDADKLYLIVKGTVKWEGQGVSSSVSQGFLGEETALNMAHYTAQATATKETFLICIPRSAAERLLEDYLSIRSDLHVSFVRHHQEGDQKAISNHASLDEPDTSSEWLKSIGWLFTMIAPLLAIYFGEQSQLDWNINLFIAVFTATLSMWIFRLVPEFVPAFFLVITTLILGMVPASVTLSGFSSSSFFMALSIFGLGSVLTTSGTTYRLALYLLNYMPSSPFWYSFALFLSGAFLTPILPSANGRINLITPLLLDISDSTRSHAQNKRFTQMATFAFAGSTLLSAVFLSSKSINLVVYGMLPHQLQIQYHWVNWSIAALIFAVTMLFGFLLLSAFFFRSMKATVVSKQQIRSQIAALGPVSMKEWVAISGISLFLFGILTSSVHKIDPSWIGLAILYVYLVLGSLDKHGFRNQIDWPFLVLLAGMVGMANTISYLELNTALEAYLTPYTQHIHNDMGLLVISLAVIVYSLRLFVPNNATVAILATILIPMGSAFGVSPWIIIFLLLIFSDGWFFPYQSTYYLLFIEQLGDKNTFDERYFLTFNALTNVLRVVAVYASVPYWKHLGIL